MEGIDPRGLGKLMISLMDSVSLRLVHGQEPQDESDVVVRLCRGLEVPLVSLRGLDGRILPMHLGKRLLRSCLPGSKPEFDRVV